MRLGAIYAKDKTVFRVWSPTAASVICNLYKEGYGNNLIEQISMDKDDEGFWVCEKDGDLHGIYYTYVVDAEGKVNETVDIYAKAAGVNGNRGMVVDLARTNPEGFLEDKRPWQESNTDAIIYELHVRDMSIDSSSGIKHKGKFLGLTEENTINSDGLATGLNHIKELGITHVQILPSYDYATVDESRLDKPQFNWGYDPKNYNVPEGSYSTDPYDGVTRIKEMKKMIMAFHKNDIRVNMDVVYNHTFDIENSWFQKTVPNYYHRSLNGEFTNGSGCGNETASDKEMMRRYIVDSVVYWASEYHVDGFRFDLMAIHDIETMKAVREALDKIDPSIMVYGEGWTGGPSGLSADKAALKNNIGKIDGVGAFNDDIRDAIKGNVFFEEDQGFVNGKSGLEEAIKFGVCGATKHADVHAAEKVFWANTPEQSVNYISCHDNYTFWDKLCISNKEDSFEDRVRMNKLGALILFTSQGITFIHAGEEMLRSKPDETLEGRLVENSFKSSDYTNSIKWDNKKNVMDVFEYYRGLIEFRKNNKAFRMREASDIQSKIIFEKNPTENVVAFNVKDDKQYFVVYNARKEAVKVKLPEGDWNILINDILSTNKNTQIVSGEIDVERISGVVLQRI